METLMNQNIELPEPPIVNGLLHSNQPLATAEPAPSNSVVQHTSLNFESNENSIRKSTSTVVDCLQDQGHVLREGRPEAQQSILSPIRTLPAELVYEVLAHCLPSQASLASQSEQAGRRAVLRLGQICHWWREIALMTPKLWTFLSLTLGPSAEEPCLAAVRAWLDRSGATGLTVRLRDNRPQQLNSHPALDLLLSQSDRWVEANLMISEDSTEHFNAIRGRVSRLKKLTIEGGDFLGNSEAPLNAFEIAPLLRSYTQRTVSETIVVPYHNLTMYDTWLCAPPRFMQTMQIAPNLTRLVVVMVGTTAGINAPFQHQRLCHLDISINDSAVRLFQFLSLPRLQHLRITLRTALSPKWVSRPVFVCFLQSMPMLQSLCLEDAHMDDTITAHDLVSCFEATPLLTKLELGRAACRALTNEVLTRMMHTPSDSHTSLLSQLEVLSVRAPDANTVKFDGIMNSGHLKKVSFHDAAFAAFLRSRNPSPSNKPDNVSATSPVLPVARLHAVTVLFDASDAAFPDQISSYIPETWDQLIIFKEEGMDTMVRYCDQTVSLI